MPLVAISVAPALVFKAEAPLSDAVASEVDALPSVSAASTSPFWADTSSLDNELSLLTPDEINVSSQSNKSFYVDLKEASTVVAGTNIRP